MNPPDPWTGPVISSFILGVCGTISGGFGTWFAWRALRVNRAAHAHQVQKDLEARQIVENEAEPIFSWTTGWTLPHTSPVQIELKRDFRNNGGPIRDLTISVQRGIALNKVEIEPRQFLGENANGFVKFITPGSAPVEIVFTIAYTTRLGMRCSQDFKRSAQGEMKPILARPIAPKGVAPR